MKYILFCLYLERLKDCVKNLLVYVRFVFWFDLICILFYWEMFKVKGKLGN